MKRYLKVIINTLLLSIGLSVTLGSFLRIMGPIYYRYQTNQKSNIKHKPQKFPRREIKHTNNYLLGLLKDSNNNTSAKRLDPLILKWKEI